LTEPISKPFSTFFLHRSTSEKVDIDHLVPRRFTRPRKLNTTPLLLEIPEVHSSADGRARAQRIAKKRNTLRPHPREDFVLYSHTPYKTTELELDLPCTLLAPRLSPSPETSPPRRASVRPGKKREFPSYCNKERNETPV
jgi:hypothetical protein